MPKVLFPKENEPKQHDKNKTQVIKMKELLLTLIFSFNQKCTIQIDPKRPIKLSRDMRLAIGEHFENLSKVVHSFVITKSKSYYYE